MFRVLLPKNPFNWKSQSTEKIRLLLENQYMDLPNRKRSFNSIYFSKDESKNWNSTKRYKNSGSTINFNLEIS
jgi:hypothetical protein